MTGQHRLAPTRRWDAWVNEHGDTRPPLVRPPRWLLRLWARLDHARFVHRNGHVVEDWRDAAYYRRLGGGVTDGAVVDGERQTVRRAATG